MRKFTPSLPETIQHADHAEIRPPDTLRAKALTKVRQNPLEVVEMIKRADKALEVLASNYTDWMLNEVKRLSESFEVFDAGPRDVEAYKALFFVAHDVRGQAMQFGYPLAGQIAGGLCELLQGGLTSPVPPLILRRYVEAISSIVRSGVKDEANAVALELAKHLVKLVTDFRRDSQQPTRAS